MKITAKNSQYGILAIAYILAFVYTFKVLNPFLYYFTQQPAFLNDTDFLKSFLGSPGGFGEYVTLFLEQFFLFPFSGALIMIGVVALTTGLVILILNRVFGKVNNVLLPGLLPLLLSVLLWHNVKYPFFINVQWLLTMIMALAYVSTQKFNYRVQAASLVLLSILLYYISGAPYLYMFAASVAIISIYKKQNIYLGLSPILLAVLLPLVTCKLLLPVTPFHAWKCFLPDRPYYLDYDYPGLVFFIFALFPLILLISIGVYKKGKLFSRIPAFTQVILITLVIIVLTFVGLKKLNNAEERIVVEMGNLALEEKWDEVLSMAQKLEKHNRYANFYTNQALFHTGRFGEELFAFQQFLGPYALFIDEPLSDEACMPSSYLYYQMGLTNNALRFAYEAQTLLPNSPYVLMQIVDCLIVTGKYSKAEYFLNQLDKNRLYHQFVIERRSFIAGENVGLNRGVVEQKRKLAPKADYYTMNPVACFYRLWQDNPENSMAYNYLLASLILDLRMNDFISILLKDEHPEDLKLSPIYQEALILYLSLSGDKRMPNSGRIPMDESLKERFNSFAKYYKMGKNEAFPYLNKYYSDTYWFYYFYTNPKVTGASVKPVTGDVNDKN